MEPTYKVTNNYGDENIMTAEEINAECEELGYGEWDGSSQHPDGVSIITEITEDE